jgi:hypothetical protein
MKSRCPRLVPIANEPNHSNGASENGLPASRLISRDASPSIPSYNGLESPRPKGGILTN